MKLASRLGVTPILLFAAGIFCLVVGRCGATSIAPENVLVIYNGDQGAGGDGFQIANYYQQVRPGVNIAPISGVDAILTGAFNEDVGGQDYLDIIRPQILSAIAAIPDTIDVIVTTKGMPLRINPGSGVLSSMESELTRIDSIDSISKMTNQFYFPGFHQIDTALASNPYYYENGPFVRAGSDPVNGDIRLSSRLDGYSVQTVKNSIDRAQNVYVVPFGQNIVVDDTGPGFPTVDQMTNSTGLGPGLFEVITGLYPDDGTTNPVPVLYDNTDVAIVASGRPVLGYVSHGTNDGGGALSLGENYLGEFVGGQFQETQIQFEFANGAVFLTHESFNAQSFDPQNTQGDGLIADWLELGGTAGLGHVSEPFNGPNNVTNEDLFYQQLLPAGGAAAAPGTSGLTFVEAAWNATRQLSYANTVVGDPLMVFQAWLPGDTNLDGVVEFNDFFTLQGNWQQAGDFEDGDFDGDGVVDENDLTILQANWLTSASGVLPSIAAGITVTPTLDTMTNEPVLDATLMQATNLNGDLNVDGGDSQILWASFGIDNGGDADGDGDTDGADFLLWQQQFYIYSLTADFNIDGETGQGDLSIWENSFNENRGGDADGDGDTDGADFLAWQREFTSNATPGTNAATVPEPSTGILAGLVFLLLTLARGRRT